MELTHTLQKSDQKRVDEVKRVRNEQPAGESPLGEQEKVAIAVCARELRVNEESKIRGCDDAQLTSTRECARQKKIGHVNFICGYTDALLTGRRGMGEGAE
jgi:hypothetical protein